jgi:uncharacterized protein YjbI with pentapeptide repeats
VRANLSPLEQVGDGKFDFPTNLEGARLGGANLDSARLSQAKLGGADLSRSRLDSADLSRADLNGANLSDVFADNADFREAEMSGVRGLRLVYSKDAAKPDAVATAEPVEP